MTPEYYDGTKLLSLSDINGNKPEIYLCTTNRTGGKTTYFNRLCVNHFMKSKSQFMLLVRWDYELDDMADKFFKDIQGLFFPMHIMRSKRKAKGVYAELEISVRDSDVWETCGYAVSLNKADAVKKVSHVFNRVERMLMDEFQSETNHYCTDEISKLLSIHTSVARGNGKQIRYVPLYMLSNAVSILNPYYVALGISNRLNSETKFLRGDGFVLEQGYVASAAQAQRESGFNRAFSSTNYVAYASENVYLSDNAAFVEKVSGPSRYLATIRYKGVDFAIRSFNEQGIIYVDKSVDYTFPSRICVTTDDMRVNYVMLSSNMMFLSQMRFYFENGAFRFRDMQCKESILAALSY